MKKWLLMFFVLAALANATAQQLQVDYPEVKLLDGRSLLHARVTGFDGETFLVEHRTGIAHVAWAKMPAEWQAKFPHDPERASKSTAVKLEKIQTQVAKQAEKDRIEKMTAAARLNPPITPPANPEMQPPNQNRDNMPDDLKVGLTTQRTARVLGRPRKIVGDEWFYLRFSLIMRDGKVESIHRLPGKVLSTGDSQ
jgi:hypothetical protein